MLLTTQVYNMLWVLLNKSKMKKVEVAKLFGHNGGWIDYYMGKQNHKQIIITEAFVKGLNRCGYDIQLVRLDKKNEGDEYGKDEKSAMEAG